MGADKLYIGVDIAKGQDVGYVNEWMILEDNPKLVSTRKIIR